MVRLAFSLMGLALTCGALFPLPLAAREAETTRAWDGGFALPQIYANRPPNIFYHNVGLLELMVTNVGVIGAHGWVDSYGAGWRGGEYLYAAGLWIGAIAGDNLPYVSTGTEGGAGEMEFRPSGDPVDTIYPAYEGIANGNRPGFSAYLGDDDMDGGVDEDFHNGKDDDKDGLIDEDYSAISQQMFSCEYWDYTDEARREFQDHRPLNLRVQQNSYAWSTEGSNEFVGFDFKIFNDGLDILRSLYVGFYVDSDAGPKANAKYYDDDGGAFYSRDTTIVDPTNTFECTQMNGSPKKCNEQKLHLDICYMYDVPDDGADANGGDVPGYFGGMFLGHTTDPFGVNAPSKVRIHTAQFFSKGGAYPNGDPRNDVERYDLLSRGTKAERPTSRPGDYRYLFSAGPFKQLAPGEHLELQTAFVIGAGLDGMLINAINAQRIYNGAWRDVDGDPLTGRYTGRGGRETCLVILPDQPPLIWRDRCMDSLNPVLRVIKDTVCKAESWVDGDCLTDGCCTPLYRSNDEALRSGSEHLVHWVGTVAPPSPGTNVDPQTDPTIQVAAPGGDRRVVLQWDNLSELRADPIQGRILFTGYRIWRVEGWKRPIGSTGPAPEDWQLIADLSLSPPDSLRSESPFYLRKYRRLPPLGPDSLNLVQTGDALEPTKWYYPPGHYQFEDTLGLKNGMIYFFDVTPYSVWKDRNGHQLELAGRPSATERDQVIPQWPARASAGDVIVVPNPYVRGDQPDGWDLVPSDADPTGTRIAFANLPRGKCAIKIFTLAGDLIQTISSDGRGGNGTAFWNLVTRNGQDVVSGVYVYSAECQDCAPGVKGCGSRRIGHFTIVR